jgi:hypothetical protein
MENLGDDEDDSEEEITISTTHLDVSLHHMDSLVRSYFECAGKRRSPIHPFDRHHSIIILRIAEGNVETLRILLSSTENKTKLLNSVDVDGFSALMIAAGIESTQIDR